MPAKTRTRTARPGARAKSPAQAFDLSKTLDRSDARDTGAAMRLAHDMERLCQDILASHEARAQRLASLRETATAMLDNAEQARMNEFEFLRQEMRANQERRMNEFEFLRQERRANQERRNRETRALLQTFQQEFAAMRAHWRGMVAGFRPARAAAR